MEDTPRGLRPKKTVTLRMRLGGVDSSSGVDVVWGPVEVTAEVSKEAVQEGLPFRYVLEQMAGELVRGAMASIESGEIPDPTRL